MLLACSPETGRESSPPLPQGFKKALLRVALTSALLCFGSLLPANAQTANAVSVSPNTGSGASQTFAFAFTDNNGAASIVSTQMLVNATLSTPGGCYFYFGRGSNAIYLADDAGAFHSPSTIGSAGTQQNSQCVLDAGASSVSMVGNNLTVNLALCFKASFVGAKSVYAKAFDGALESGWVLLGGWTVTTSSTPQADFSLSMAPSSQTVAMGGSTSYTVTVTGSNGFSGTVSFSTSLLPAGASGSFNPPTVAGSGMTTLTINTASNASMGSFSITVTGTSGSLSHDASASLVINSGGPASSPPTAVSVTPASGSGSAQTFAFMFSDANGPASIVSAQMLMNATLSTTGGCYLFFARASNAIYLADDSGTFHSPSAIGSAGTQQNSQCVLDAGASSVSIAGNTLTVNLALSFQPAFVGTQNVFAKAFDGSQEGNWALLGTWTP